MLLQSQQVTPRSKTFKTTLLAASVAVCFLLYQAWNHQDRIADELAEHLRLPTGYGLGEPPAVAAEDETVLADEGIPKRIWYKLGPKGKSQQIEEWTQSCIKQNPTYRYEFFSDPSADYWVEKTFSASRPDIVEAYLSLTVPILKADLLRYLLLYVEGGVWSDLDVSCEGIPIDEWIPEEHRSETNLLVGWEFDAGWNWEYTHEFASWTILSKPGVPHMLMVIDDIIDSIHQSTAEANVTIAELTMEIVGDIVDYTGPRRMTRSILKSLERALGKPIGREMIENIRDPVRVLDVTILPGYAFANLTNKFDEEDGPVGPTLVSHHYAGTWKNENGGELARRQPMRI
ncbi:lpha-mannosyltransferase och1 [Diaporthe amygdali]|uniref:lpha-mannosyltransferase och1 n=1 Tax=Phomopsis amygdali TaxID=1214568 RepID=UPI0022FEF80B|nr:lpha-mannosyltransferase och1 [Diaporthe amygdali]KAJ0115770.1 lpha-mannosyltransferase och1 [Diaporthe amygdali]